MGKGMFDNVLSDYLWARAIVLTTPTIASVVLNVQVPLSILADALFKDHAPTVEVGRSDCGTYANVVCYFVKRQASFTSWPIVNVGAWQASFTSWPIVNYCQRWGMA